MRQVCVPWGMIFLEKDHFTLTHSLTLTLSPSLQSLAPLPFSLVHVSVDDEQTA